jgi:hypothetical protein
MKVEIDIKQCMKIGLVFFSITAVLWLLSACSDDAPQQDGLEDARIELRAFTRVDDEGEELEEHADKANIHVFLYNDENGGSTTEGMFLYHEDEDIHYWTAQDLKVKPGTRKFYLFGYMPHIDGYSGTINVNERQLTLTGIEPMTPNDICVVTGVSKSAVAAMPLRGSYDFDYVNSAYNERTILNLRLEHLFGRLLFKFKVGAKYSALRQIKVKTLKIDTKTYNSISATINLPKNKDDVITVDYSGTGEKTWESDLLKSDQEPVLLSTTAVAVGSSINVAVGGGLSEQYELVSTFDVYDLQGHKLSERTARNKLKDVLPVKSQVKEVVLTIEPTYLYQLGDDDLDNPEVKIN